MEKKWKQFERLVAAIHYTSEHGATVTWHDKIDGREFDVTIRFQYHSYEYLTVIECRDYATAVPVGDVEAFVTKSRHVGANKAVMVSANGFQSGAKKVAQKESIELFTLKEEEGLPPELIARGLTPALVIMNFEMFDLDGKSVITLSNEADQLTYQVHSTKLRDSEREVTLQELLEERMAGIQAESSDQERSWTLTFNEETTVEVPFEDPKPVSRITFTSQIVEATIIDSPVLLPPSFFTPSYQFTNELTEESQRFGGADVRLGFDTELKPRTFYTNPSLGYHYFIEKIEDDLATIQLVESYQHGTLFQSTFTQKLEHAKYFVEVTDEKEIQRLEKIRDRYRRRTQKDSKPPQREATIGRNQPCHCGSGIKFKKCHGR